MGDGKRWGLTLPLPTVPLRDHEEVVRRAEAAGYTDLWSGETQGPDGFTPLALASQWTEHMRLGTGVVGVFTRCPALLAGCLRAVRLVRHPVCRDCGTRFARPASSLRYA